MPPFRIHGPICQVTDWYKDIDDGTLVRTPSPVPAAFGSTKAAPAKVVASGNCSFLNPKAVGTVQVPKAAFDRLRKDSPAAKISAPKAKDSQVWPDKSTGPAIEQDIEIGSQKIKLIRPTDDKTAGKNLPTTAQVAEALRAIPAAERAYTKMVILSPLPASGSTPQKTIAGEGGSGEIDLYPVGAGQ